MNVYEIDIWRSVSHDGQFSHTVQRFEVIHALNEERAKKKIVLEPAKTYIIGSTKTEVTAEYIYRIKKAGTVTIQPFYVYSNGRSPRLVR